MLTKNEWAHLIRSTKWIFFLLLLIYLTLTIKYKKYEFDFLKLFLAYYLAFKIKVYFLQTPIYGYYYYYYWKTQAVGYGWTIWIHRKDEAYKTAPQWRKIQWRWHVQPVGYIATHSSLLQTCTAQNNVHNTATTEGPQTAHLSQTKAHMLQQIHVWAKTKQR